METQKFHAQVIIKEIPVGLLNDAIYLLRFQMTERATGCVL